MFVALIKPVQITLRTTKSPGTNATSLKNNEPTFVLDFTFVSLEEGTVANRSPSSLSSNRDRDAAAFLVGCTDGF